MRKIILLLVLALVTWKGYEKYGLKAERAVTIETPALVADTDVGEVTAVPSKIQADHPVSFVCDGRTHCSQMTSCEEAKYFLQHCPTVKMDGDGDGIPCERQFCN